MHMKVTIAAALLLAVMGSVAHAQNGSPAPQRARHSDKNKDYPKFYVQASGGYFLSVSPGEYPNVGPFGPYETFSDVNPSTGAQTAVISNKILTGSYGAGWRTGVAADMNLNKYVGLELGFHYYKSQRNLMTHQVEYADGAPAGTPPVLSLESKGYVNAFDVAPALVISPGQYQGFNPYVRFGLVIPVYGRLHIHTDGNAVGETTEGGATFETVTVFHRDETVTPSASLGFQGAVGVSHPLGRHLDVFAEAEYRNVPVESKSDKVTAYQQVTQVIDPANGQTVQTVTVGLSDLTTAQRNTTYQTTLTQNSNTPTDNPTTNLNPTYANENIPANALKSYINIGGLGINAGLRWRL